MYMYAGTNRLPSKAEAQKDGDDRCKVCHAITNELVEQRAVTGIFDVDGRCKGAQPHHQPSLRLSMAYGKDPHCH